MLRHSAVNKVANVLNATKRKPKNIWLYGECGTGKSELVRQVADKLALDFYTMSLSGQTTTHKLVGFLDANSNYKATPLRLAYENGGLICLEECDTVNSGVLAEINNILSQDIYSFPDKTISKHEDFQLICCANSNGQNTDIKYCKAQQMDASIRDRFIFINVEFEPELAKELTNNDDWFNRVMKFREVIKQICGDDVVVGMRAMIDGADLLDAGFSQSEVEDMVIYKGIDEDIIESIKAKMDIKEENTTKKKTKKYKSNDFNIEDGIITMKDDNDEIAVYLDEEYCKEKGFELAQEIKAKLGLH